MYTSDVYRAREAAKARALSALNSLKLVDLHLDDYQDDEIVEAILEVLYPTISKQHELLGVPEGSILLDKTGFFVFIIKDGYLTNYRTNVRVGKDFVEKHGPLTVLVMP